jgi:thermostable 8-oxoguanine DNA glycosylase
MELVLDLALYQFRKGRTEVMLVERGLQVMNVEVVGQAYGIASNYLRRTVGISDAPTIDERLLEIVMDLFQRGEFNKIRLANKAITKFEATNSPDR